MPLEAGTQMNVGIRPIERPQSSGGPDRIGQRTGGSSAEAFSPRTNVALQVAVDDMAGILAKIASAQSEAMEKMPQELQEVIRNVLKQAFSFEETLGQGLSSTVESQRFTAEQLTSMSRMLNQMAALAEKGTTPAVSDTLQVLLTNLKSMVSNGSADSKILEPVLLLKASFDMLVDRNFDDLPQEMQQLLLSLQPKGQPSIMPFEEGSTLGFLKQLVQFFMPRPATAESQSQAQQATQQEQAQGNQQEGRSQGTTQGQTTQQGSQAQQGQATQQGRMQQQGQMQNTPQGQAQGGSQGAGQTGQGQNQAQQTGQFQANQGQQGQNLQQGQNTAQNQPAMSQQGQASQNQPQMSQQGQNAAPGGQAAAYEGQSQAQAQTSQGGQPPQAQQGQSAQGQMQPQGQTAAQQGQSSNTQGQNLQQGQNTATSQSGQGAMQSQQGGTAPGQQAIQQPMQQEGVFQQFRMQSQRGQLTQPNAPQQEAMQQAKAQLMSQNMENTPQTMETMKELAQLLLKNSQLTQRDTQLLQNFVNGRQTAMGEQEARQLQQLIRLCQQNVPVTVQQAALQQNIPDLPRLYAFMQLCDMANARQMTAKQLKRAGRDVAAFVLAMRGSMSGDNSMVQGQRSLSFMMPMYLGENEQSYPSYIHVYDEAKQDPETGYYKKETWLRLCVLTENIGAVELTCRVFDDNQLDMRLFFSDSEIADEFRASMQDIRQALRGSENLQLNELKVGAVGERRFI